MAPSTDVKDSLGMAVRKEECESIHIRRQPSAIAYGVGRRPWVAYSAVVTRGYEG